MSGALGMPRPCTVTTDPSGGPSNLMMRGDGQEMRQIAEILSQFTGRTVRDKTGLTGQYDFDLKWSPEAGAGCAPPHPQSANATLPTVQATRTNILKLSPC